MFPIFSNLVFCPVTLCYENMNFSPYPANNRPFAADPAALDAGSGRVAMTCTYSPIPRSWRAAASYRARCNGRAEQQRTGKLPRSLANVEAVQW